MYPTPTKLRDCGAFSTFYKIIGTISILEHGMMLNTEIIYRNYTIQANIQRNYHKLSISYSLVLLWISIKHCKIKSLLITFTFAKEMFSFM